MTFWFLSLIGPRDFADRAIQAIRAWTFEPATSDGKPVAQSRTQPYIYTRSPNDRRMVLPPLEAVQALKAAPGLVEQGKPEDARAKLEDVLKNVRLAFADRTAVASALAELAYRRGDYLEARRLAVIATTVTVPNTPATQQQDVWRNRIKADLKLGEIPDALHSLIRLRQIRRHFRSTLPAYANGTHATADAASLLTVQAGFRQRKMAMFMLTCPIAPPLHSKTSRDLCRNSSWPAGRPPWNPT